MLFATLRPSGAGMDEAICSQNVHIHVHRYLSICIYIYTYIYICIYLYVYNMYVSVYIYIYLFIHTYACIYTCTYIYIRTHICKCNEPGFNHCLVSVCMLVARNMDHDLCDDPGMISTTVGGACG